MLNWLMHNDVLMKLFLYLNVKAFSVLLLLDGNKK